MSDDLIRRLAAIKAMECISDSICEQQAIDALWELPAIEAEPRWIPVTEKMPEENEAVNVTWVNHLPENYYKSIKDKPFTATAVFYRGDWYWWSDTLQDYLAEYGLCPIYRMDRAIEVIAWMPLPEPYREVEE